MLKPSWLIVILMSAPALATADFATYSDRGAWESAVAGSIVESENFNSAGADVVFTDSSTSIGVIGLSSTGGAAGNMLIDAIPGEFSSGNGIDGSTFLNAGGLGSTSTLTITFPWPVQAFGFDTMNYDAGGERAEIFVDGQSVGLTPSCPGSCIEPDQTYGFVGVVSTTGMSTVTVQIVGAAGTVDVAAGLDNLDFVRFIPVQPVPGLGLLGMLALIGLFSFIGLNLLRVRPGVSR